MKEENEDRVDEGPPCNERQWVFMVDATAILHLLQRLFGKPQPKKENTHE